MALYPDQLPLPGEAEAVQLWAVSSANHVNVVDNGAVPESGEAVKVKDGAGQE